MVDQERFTDQLAEELRKLRKAPDPAPEATEQAVLEAFRRRREKPKVAAWRLAAAAVALIAVGVVAWFQTRSGGQSEEARPTVQIASQQSTGFIVLDPLAPGILEGHGRLVRITLPPGEGFAGLPAPPNADGAALQADILLGDDGIPHAVRFIY